ncbi:MAG: NAD(P)-dependent oxidoreductase [Lentisphaeria bacterium]|nr:NAD(P)-dependent oxidoreductase [Lentisphaeria bacterium]
MKTVIILGGTSHIAKGLIGRFLKQPDFRIEWFGRSAERMEAFLDSEQLSGNIAVHGGYEDFFSVRCDALINCVGAGTPDKLKDDYTLWFFVLEKYDNLCLDYLKQINPAALYVDFSSGAIYGRDPGGTGYRIDPNRIQPPDYYALAKLYSEAKHRANLDLNIVDIRIFSYFSRYADPDSGYLMTDILKAVLKHDVLKTTGQDLVRDYISPDDLFALIQCCQARPKINTAFDAFSRKPASKLEILSAFQEKFGLRTEIADLGSGSPNSTASVYIPRNHTAETIGFKPRFTALDGLIRETDAAVDSKHSGYHAYDVTEKQSNPGKSSEK